MTSSLHLISLGKIEQALGDEGGEAGTADCRDGATEETSAKRVVKTAGAAEEDTGVTTKKPKTARQVRDERVLAPASATADSELASIQSRLMLVKSLVVKDVEEDERTSQIGMGCGVTSAR